MPEKLEFNAELPALAKRFPMAAALLSAFDHAGILCRYSMIDVVRMDQDRGRFVYIESAFR